MKMLLFAHFTTIFKCSSVLTDDNVPIGKCKDCHDTKPTFGLLATDRSKAVVLV